MSVLEIVVVKEGWVLIGRVTPLAGELQIEGCSVIRRWGTTRGLAELANEGMTQLTVIEPAVDVVLVPNLSVIMRMVCKEEKWQGR